MNLTLDCEVYVPDRGSSCSSSHAANSFYWLRYDHTEPDPSSRTAHTHCSTSILFPWNLYIRSLPALQECSRRHLFFSFNPVFGVCPTTVDTLTARHPSMSTILETKNLGALLTGPPKSFWNDCADVCWEVLKIFRFLKRCRAVVVLCLSSQDESVQPLHDCNLPFCGSPSGLAPKLRMLNTKRLPEQPLATTNDSERKCRGTFGVSWKKTQGRKIIWFSLLWKFSHSQHSLFFPDKKCGFGRFCL